MGSFLRESILTDKDIAKYKTQWGKKAETAKIEAGFNTDWLLDIRALKFKSSSKSIIVKVTENDEFLRKIQKLGYKCHHDGPTMHFLHGSTIIHLPVMAWILAWLSF